MSPLVNINTEAIKKYVENLNKYVEEETLKLEKIEDTLTRDLLAFKIHCYKYGAMKNAGDHHNPMYYSEPSNMSFEYFIEWKLKQQDYD